MTEKLTPLAKKLLENTERARLEKDLPYFEFGWLHLPCRDDVVEAETKNGTVKHCKKHGVSSQINLNTSGEIIAY